MKWHLELTGRARRELRRLDAQVADRVVRALERLATTEEGDVARLHGVENEWRLRVGDWRVRLQYDYTTHTLRVLRVLPRGRAYRD